MKTAYVVVDGPLEGDFRLLRSMEPLAGEAEIIDISCPPDESGPSATRTAAEVARLVLQASALSLGRWRTLRAVLGPQKAPTFAGMLACLRWLRLVVLGAYRLRSHAGFTHGAEFHAHDLYCAATAVLAGLPSGSKLVYDSHEFQIHRNRATGWARILIEAGLEQVVLRRADELHVVNHAIERVMRQLHEMPPKVRICLNDFYRYHPSRLAPPTQPPALVYVGKGVRGRQLELLDQPADALGFDVFTYFLGALLPPHIQGTHWHQGPPDYEQSLLAVVRARRCLMWCCLSTTSVSYRLATPNKLFQALAMGIPIVATRGTYLAELVDRHEIGAVLDDGDLRRLAQDVLSPLYEKWVRRVDEFRTGLQDGSVVI